MASMGELAILLRADNQITPELNAVNASLVTNEHNWKTSAAGIDTSNQTTVQSIAKSRTAMRQLGQGVMYLGTTFLSMGLMMEQTNSQFGKTLGSTLIFIGSIASAIGSSFQFVAAIGRMANALRVLTAQEILARAFSPVGLITLGVGAAVAVATIAAVNSKVASSSAAKSSGPVTNVTVLGSVTAEKKLADTITQAIIQKANQNGTSGVK